MTILKVSYAHYVKIVFKLIYCTLITHFLKLFLTDRESDKIYLFNIYYIIFVEYFEVAVIFNSMYNNSEILSIIR